MNKLLCMCLLVITLLPCGSNAGVQPEKFYQKEFCTKVKGEIEYVLSDKTRVDCLTHVHAIEVDFAHKWYEAVGQSLFYSLHTGKRAGILLILEKPDDYKYFIRLNSTIKYHKLKIRTWFVKGY